MTVVLISAGCNPATPSPVSQQSNQSAAPTAPNSVTISNYAYAPATLTVKKGTTVTWVNKDIAKHTVTGNNGGPASSLFGQNEQYTYTFDTVGIFPYFCEPHPYMKAMVVVTE
jgi:plastocyanin